MPAIFSVYMASPYLFSAFEVVILHDPTHTMFNPSLTTVLHLLMQSQGPTSGLVCGRHTIIMVRNQGRINKIRNENGEITTDNTEIQRIIRDYYQQLYASKMGSLEEMDKFLEKYNLPKLNQEETDNLNRSITSTEIKL